MAKKKQTPGPWMYRRNEGIEPDNWPYLIEKQGTPGKMDWGQLIAKCWEHLCPGESQEANAILLAAAPELLAACIEAERLLSEVAPENLRVLSILRAVIAKVEV